MNELIAPLFSDSKDELAAFLAPGIHEDVERHVKAGNCSGAEEIANTAPQLLQTALCYARQDQHAGAARTARRAADLFPETDRFSAGCKLMMRALAAGQDALALASSPGWREVGFVLPYSQEMTESLNLLFETIANTWSSRLSEKLANTGLFGPMRFGELQRKLTYHHVKERTAGGHPLLGSMTAITLTLDWTVYGLVQRFRKKDEFSDGHVIVTSTLYATGLGTEVSLDLVAPSLADLKIVPNSLNPEFKLQDLLMSVIAVNAGSFAPNLNVASVSLGDAVKKALPWLPATPPWTILTLEVREADVLIGASVGLP